MVKKTLSKKTKSYFYVLTILFLNYSVDAQEAIPIYSDIALPLQKTAGELNVGIINYSELNQVEKLKRFEIGMQFPDSIQKRVTDFLTRERSIPNGGLNPFLEWSVNVEATFLHKKSGTVETISGFYYRNYRPNSVTNDWDEIPTDYAMRVRFAPKLAGEWTCFLTLKINKDLIATSRLINFNVIENNKIEYVRVHPNQKNLQQNGEIIYPVGHNFLAPEEGVAVYHDSPIPPLPPNKTNKAASVKNWKFYQDMIQSYFSQGGKYIRTIQAPWSSLIEFETKGNYYDRLHYAWEQDYLIETCEKNDGLILFNLMLQEPMMLYGDYYFYDWDWDKYSYEGNHYNDDPYPVYCYNDNPGVKKPHEMFLLEDDLKYHEQRIRYYVSRYGYSTCIYAFEILSEPYHLDQFWQEQHEQEPYFNKNHPDHEKVIKALYTYHTRMGDYIKNTLHSNQLVSVNTAVAVWSPHGSTIVDSSLYSSNIDFIGVNFYSMNPHKLLVSKNRKSGNNNFDSSENSFARLVNDFQTTFNKPIILSEGGPSEETLDCSDYKEFPVDMASLPMTGLAGSYGWNGYRSKERFLWESTISIANELPNFLIPTLSELNGNWIQGRQTASISRKDKVSALELQYYISEGQTKSVGYVKNRTYNFYTQKTASKCAYAEFSNGEESPYYPTNESINISAEDLSRRNRLIVEGLKRKTDYTITWTKVDIQLKHEKIRTNRKGELILSFPELKVTDSNNALPIVWFRID